MKLIFLGAPGAGKGTQAEIIAGKLNIPTISTGNIIREALANGTEMGLKAKSFIEAGKLVPDDVVIGIIKERLANEDCNNGFILDGFPRTIPQAEALDNMGIIIDKVVDIDVARLAVLLIILKIRNLKLKAYAMLVAVSFRFVRMMLPRQFLTDSMFITNRPNH